MVDSMVERIRGELGPAPVIATGGLAQLIASETHSIERVELTSLEDEDERAVEPGLREHFRIDVTVTPGMMSLAGCSGENFASVLRSLGYRMEKRPKPIEPPPAPVPLEAPAQAQSQDASLAETAPTGEVVAPADAPRQSRIQCGLSAA